jgi:hypothetical protein
MRLVLVLKALEMDAGQDVAGDQVVDQDEVVDENQVLTEDQDVTGDQVVGTASDRQYSDMMDSQWNLAPVGSSVN